MDCELVAIQLACFKKDKIKPRIEEKPLTRDADNQEYETHISQ
jgi:hypothetical protein